MVSCIEVETASLVFACISLFSGCMGTLVCIACMVNINIFLLYLERKPKIRIESFNADGAEMSHFGFYLNIGLTIALIAVIISFMFSIILTTGLLTKRAKLIKVYFMYGVVMNTSSLIFAVFTILFYNIHVGLICLFGCFIYAIILIMIQRSYQKMMDKGYDQFSHKEVTENC